MRIIPTHYGYIVTDGRSWTRSFSDRAYETRSACLIDAISFANQMSLCYPRFQVLQTHQLSTSALIRAAMDHFERTANVVTLGQRL